MSGRRPSGLFPHLFVRGAEAAVAFYRQAFGAAELFRTVLPDGKVLYVELAFGDHRVHVSEETPALRALAPPSIGGTPVLLTLQVEDVDAVVRQAVAAGAAVEMPAQEMFFGERYALVRDPFGHRWALSTGREQLTPDEIARRAPPRV